MYIRHQTSHRNRESTQQSQHPTVHFYSIPIFIKMRLISVAALITSTSMVAAQDFLVRMHTQLITDPLLDDIYQIKAVSYQSGEPVVVCRMSTGVAFSNNEQQICVDGVDGIKNGFGCIEGWAVCVWENGRMGSAACES